MFLSENEKIARLQLIRSPLIGSVKFRKLIKVYGNAINALKYLPAIFKQSKKNKDFKIYSESLAKAELEDAFDKDINAVFLFDDFYPKTLEKIEGASPVLFVKSRNLSALKDINSVAIVGTRNSTLPAEKFCIELSEDLAKDDICVVSGLAVGVDSSAHRGALNKGKNFPTVAVLAGGVDVVYPSKNRFLYDEIIEKNGAVISDMPCGTQPSANLFPVRNKIIAGLSRGVVVVEAKAKSGSLITAEMAKEYGRAVMAVPGFPTDERAKGPNLLLKQGAALIESANDVKNALINIRAEEKVSSYDFFEINECDSAPLFENIESVKALILSKLTKTPVEIDDLVAALNIDVALVLRALLELELVDLVVSLPQNRVSKSM
ncbi:MAG: DNA-processing protein DprA [Rickettsiales bacterium]|jgi:DNA processing protein|nr:DNA-processing protein DprA [Rickettsiales bacterium]